MASKKRFTKDEWKEIFKELNQRGTTYGLPARRTDTLVLASWNLRQFGKLSKGAASRERDVEAFRFLASVITHFDLVALQEVKDDLASLRELHTLLPDYHLVVSDTTGNEERLAFLYRAGRVRRTDLAGEADVPMELVQARMKGGWQEFKKAFDDYGKKLQANPKYKGRIKLPATVGFERSPHCVSFDTGVLTKPLSFLAFNTHIFYGKSRKDRTSEFLAFLDWLYGRWASVGKIFAPNFLVFGDMNAEVAAGDARTSRQEILAFLNKADTDSRKRALRKAKGAAEKKLVKSQVTLFPFIKKTKWLEPPKMGSNLAGTEYFDQIILMMRTLEAGGQELWGVDVFDIPSLVDNAIDKSASYRTDRIRQQMSDHLPVWVRVELPEVLLAGDV